jgi:RNA polymerase sigma-70 factor, ECF subfamily
MSESEVAVFSAERGRLLGLAYRMTGSLAEAEDVVQDAWLRWSGTDRSAVDNPAAWLTTVTTRLSLDRLKAIDRRRAHYVGQWLPEPVATTRGPEEAAEVADSLTLGFLVLLDRLTPLERAVFLLAEVFAEPYSEIAATVDRRPDACRQIASRARRKLEAARRPRPDEDRDGGADPAPDRSLARNTEVLEQLVTAVLSGDVDRVLALLDPEVVLVSDGGPNRHAARQPVVGPPRVARLLINLAGRLDHVTPTSIIELNDRPALRMEVADGPVVMQIEQVGGRVRTLWFLLNPEKLHGLDDVAGLR